MLNFVAWGTEAFGNNTPVTPSIPPGTVDGDHLLLFTYIRENGASPFTPSGWSLVSGYSASAIECTEVIYYRRFVAGDTAPTVTFTGGGSNDVTYAQIATLRSDQGLGVVCSVAGLGAWETTNDSYILDLSQTIYTTNGAVAFLVGHPNDVPSPTVSLMWLENGSVSNTRFSTYVTPYTALGADATLVAGIVAPNFNPNDNSDVIRLSTSFGAAATGQHIIAIKMVETLLKEYTGSGGVAIGGAAVASYLPAGSYEYTPQGGAAAGGTIPAVETAEFGLREQQPQVTAFRKDSIGSITFNWSTAALDANTLLLMCVSSNQSSVTPAGVAVPICPAGWNEYTEIAPNSVNKLRVFWKRWTPGDSATVTVDFSGDTVANISKSGSINFFRNTDWAFAGGNPFGTARNDSGTSALTYFYLTQTSATASTQITVKSSGSIISQGAGTGWKILPNSYAGGGGQTSVDVRAGYRFVAGARLTQTQETEYFASGFASTYHHAHFPIATLGGAMTYEAVGSGGAIVGGAATIIPPAVPADYPWIAHGGTIIGGSTAASFTPGPTPRLISALSLAWGAARRLIGADRAQFFLRLGATTYRLRSIRITRKLDSGNSIEAIVMSPARPCNVGQELTAGILTLSGSGQTLGERTWTVAVDRVTELEPGRQAWSVRATEITLRPGGLAWAPAKISMRTTTGARAAPDFNVVAGDSYNGRVIANVTTYIQAQGAGATEISYG